MTPQRQVVKIESVKVWVTRLPSLSHPPLSMWRHRVTCLPRKNASAPCDGPGSRWLTIIIWQVSYIQYLFACQKSNDPRPKNCQKWPSLKADFPPPPSWEAGDCSHLPPMAHREIATVTNCDNSGILAVAFCDLSHFVIMAMTALTESNNTENVFRILGRVPMFTFDMNMKSCILAHVGVISLVHMFVCMFISYKAHNRCTQETFLKWSDFDVNMFSALRSTPSVTMKSIWAVVFWTVTNCDSHKLRQFRNSCRRNLWFVAICDQGRDGTNWVK